MDDGGLSRARADLRAQARAYEQRRQADLEAVERALANQAARVRKATAAFFLEASPPNVSAFLGYEPTEPERARSRLEVIRRIRREAQRGEPIHRSGYKLFEHHERAQFAASYTQALVLWESGVIELEDDRAEHLRPKPSEHVHPGALPFHVNPLGWRGRYEHGAVPRDRGTASQMEAIDEATEFFVALLAGYIDGPRIKFGPGLPSG